MSKSTALVTGAAGGIGRAAAVALAEAGFRLAIHGRKIDDRLKELKGIIDSYGQDTILLEGDISKEKDCCRIVSELGDETKDIGVLVNNAGITRDGLVIKMSGEDFSKVIENNLDSCFYLSREVFKYMMKAKKGRIINVSSVVGIHGNASQANYSAAKAGVIGLTKSCAKEFARRKVTVNAVAPGFVETAMTDKLPDSVREEMLKTIPLGRYGKVEDIAAMIKFLASDEAGYITGQVFSIDGGMNI